MIPLKFIFIICLFFVGGLLWLFTHGKDFVTPPPAEKLAQIRQQALAAIPAQSRQEKDSISAVIPFLAEESITKIDPSMIAAIDTGDLNKELTLDQFADRAPEGAIHLLTLALALEEKDRPDHAVLAYERVVDLSQGNPNEIQKATQSILRLRNKIKPWIMPQESIPTITINFGTGQRFEKDLPEIASQLSAEFSAASSGILQFASALNVSPAIQTDDTPTPVAIWLTGSEEGGSSTDILSFLAISPETLKSEAEKAIFKLIRNHLMKNTPYNPVPEAGEAIDVAMNSHITRLLWENFGSSLNPTQDSDQISE